MTSAAEWWLGARPRTLPAAVVPVVIGTAVAYEEAIEFVAAEWLPRAALAMVVSLALQVGVNYANDYSDGVRGTDDERAGPLRLVASKRATPRAVKRAAFVAFGMACVAGLVLAALTTWWLIAVGVVSVGAAWTYTGGPRPYGYAGFGEVFVFVFFGLVATAGTSFVIVESVSLLAVLSGALAGLLAVALLMVNNIRDIAGDARSGKQTLAVRLGDRRSRLAFSLVYVLAVVVVFAAATQSLGAVLGAVGLLAALPAVSTVRAASSAPQLIAALGMTARTQLIVGAFYALGLVIQ